MRIRSFWLLVVLIAACVHETNPDPRHLDAEALARRGLGAWIIVETPRGSCEVCDRRIEGELIAIDPAKPSGVMFVHSTEGLLVRIHEGDIDHATAYLYDIGQGIETWRTLGGLSTLSHGFWLILTMPFWLGVSAAIINGEMEKSILRYPDHGLDELARWARFPQGLPRGINASTLEHQNRMVKALPSPPPPPSPPPADAGVDAASDATVVAPDAL